MFLGEIVAVYVNEDCITDGKPNPLKLNPIIMMGASYYSLNEVVGNLFRTGLKLSENK
jgi:flavin reductase (DIM6/NTAB) family NADH-FMN oxidoreductase RutF